MNWLIAADTVQSIQASNIQASDIQASSVGWQVQLLGQRLKQWIEWQLSKAPDDAGPDPNPMVWPAWLGPVLLWFLIGCLVLLLALLLLQALEYLLNYRQPYRAQGITAITEAEVPHLSVAEWVRQAHQLAQAGHWQAACHAFYRAALQKLHDREWISHQPSRTDREYLQRLETVTQPRPYQLLIRTHERSHFGEDTLTEENFQRCRQAYRELDKS